MGRGMEHRAGRPPQLRLLLSEPGRAAGEFGLMLAAGPLRRTLPPGDGHPVLVMPGLMADDLSTAPLRRVLRRLGYRAYGWGLGRNVGPTARIMVGMRERLAQLHRRHGEPVSVVGWSLGGIYARDLAREQPDAVRQVITLGSPFRIMQHRQSWASPMYLRFRGRHAVHRQLPPEQGVEPLRVPATSIYTRGDGIVAWQACVDEVTPLSENVRVVGSHCGLGFHPAVIWVIADRLAQPAGQWQPFRPPSLARALYPPPDAAEAPVVAEPSQQAAA